MASAGRDGVLESDFRRAPVIKGSNMSLKVSAEPLQVVLRDESGAARRVADVAELAGAARELLTDASAASRMGEAGLAFCRAHQGAVHRVLEMMKFRAAASSRPASG